MAWAAVSGIASATIGAAGSYASAKEANKVRTTASSQAQDNGATEGIQWGNAAWKDAMKLGTYNGPRTAGLNPYQIAGYNGVAGFAGNQGVGTANGLLGYAQGALDSGGLFGTNANTLYQKAGVDPTQQIIGNGAQYANNPYLDGQIDAASRDITRNFNEVQMPGLDQGAALSGNMNSSRTGVAQGIMARGAQDRIGDISATMRGNAYTNGMGMAQDQYNQSFSNQLNANNQVLGSSRFGLDAANTGLGMGYNAYDAMTRAGAGFQGQQQALNNDQRDLFREQQNGNLDLTGKYMNLISGNFGTPPGPQTSTTGAALQGGLTGAMGGLGLYGKLQGMGNSSQPWANPNAGAFNYFANNYNSENYG